MAMDNDRDDLILLSGRAQGLLHTCNLARDAAIETIQRMPVSEAARQDLLSLLGDVEDQIARAHHKLCNIAASAAVGDS